MTPIKGDLSNQPASPNAVLFPAYTWDYYVKCSKEIGLGLIARRNIKKGELVFGDSLE